MHEISIAQDIVDLVIENLPKDEDVRVTKVRLKIGLLATVMPETLEFCFEIVAKDTPLNGAKLEIEEIPIIAKCNNCGNEFSVDNSCFICPRCNSGEVEILQGNEFNVVDFEITEKTDENDYAEGK